MENLLQENRDKKEYNKNASVSVNVENVQKLVPEMDFLSDFSSMGLEMKERSECNKVRMSFHITPLCTNAMHNNVTEIVRYEGSDSAMVLNSSGYVTVSGALKPDGWCQHSAIMDTELSSKSNGFSYHCGIDIFGNHTLRNKSFRSVCSAKTVTDKFNTLSDNMREWDGNPVTVPPYGNEPEYESHMYSLDGIMSFEDCIANRMKEKEGWLGFRNASTLPVQYEVNGEYEAYEINRTICSEKPGSFIDLYPGRDLYTFKPKWNPYRKRYERNWDFRITYPSSSTTDVSFISKDTGGLKAVYIDECSPLLTGGRNLLFVYSVSRHGLSVGDGVTIYRTYLDGKDTVSEVMYRNATVVRLGDGVSDNEDFVFAVRYNGTAISTHWLSIYDFTDGSFSEGDKYAKAKVRDVKSVSTDVSEQSQKGGDSYSLSESLRYAYKNGNDSDRYYFVNKRVNIDPQAQDISFRRCVDGEELDYYVRMFSEVPNWKYASSALTEETSPSMETQCAASGFSMTDGRLSFSESVYGDSVGQVIVNDDVDLSYMKDNLGRPVSEVFLTIVKKDNGYREWYGKDGAAMNPQSDKVEVSHAFGKLSEGFELSMESLVTPERHPNVRLFQNVDSFCTEPLNAYDSDEHPVFYGDLCCFSKSKFLEESIDYGRIRFNTAQRELVSGDTAYEVNQMYGKNYTRVIVDDIIGDDESEGGFSVVTSYLGNSAECVCKEGVYYIPHYQVPIHEIGGLEYVSANYTGIRRFTFLEGGAGYRIKTNGANYMMKGDSGSICHTDESGTKRWYHFTVESVVSEKEFSVTGFVGVSQYEVASMFTPSSIKRMDVIHRPDGIPPYAVLCDFGGYRYTWRDVIHNGSEVTCEMRRIPFANGAFYSETGVILALRRQDPFGKVCEYVPSKEYCLQPEYPAYDAYGVEIVKVSMPDDGYEEPKGGC